MNMLNELGSIVLDTRSLGGFSDEKFYQFCMDNRGLKFERDSERNIIIMSNTGGETGNFNAELLGEFVIWNRKNGRGKCFDSSTAFTLPNKAVRSPDVAWIEIGRWSTLTNKQKVQFPPLCPDFVIEIKSTSDSLLSQKNKMDEWIANGCRLAWLINPEEKITYVYHNGNVHHVAFDKTLSGADVVVGFEIALSKFS